CVMLRGHEVFLSTVRPCRRLPHPFSKPRARVSRTWASVASCARSPDCLLYFRRERSRARGLHESETCRSVAARRSNMALQKLFGERATTKIAAIFDTHGEACAMADRIRADAHLNTTQVHLIGPDDGDYSKRMEPETAGVF